jgi:glutamine phosphoribosylpyrophosphate amidotransferase
MCGIAGRTLHEPGSIGADLTAMMVAQRHRGWDSTGFALYGTPREDGYVVRALLDERAHLDEDLEALRAVTREYGADFVQQPTWDQSGQPHVLARLVVSEPEPFSAWVDACDALARVELQSAGRALEIVKDLGDAHEVAHKHGVEAFVGTHGLGHVRLATESNVSPVAGHPFWARPFPDVAIVHNGQLTNYYTWRRRLQRRGYRFTTENDSELIAVWNSDAMAAGDSLRESLQRSLSELDGVFTYLLATDDGIALAKDRWAIKPVVAVVASDGVAVATEEQSLRTLYRDEIEVEVHDGPSIVRVWRAGAPVPAGMAA